jgi:hypothetical protein
VFLSWNVIVGFVKCGIGGRILILVIIMIVIIHLPFPLTNQLQTSVEIPFPTISAIVDQRHVTRMFVVDQCVHVILVLHRKYILGIGVGIVNIKTAASLLLVHSQLLNELGVALIRESLRHLQDWFLAIFAILISVMIGVITDGMECQVGQFGHIETLLLLRDVITTIIIIVTARLVQVGVQVGGIHPTETSLLLRHVANVIVVAMHTVLVEARRQVQIDVLVSVRREAQLATTGVRSSSTSGVVGVGGGERPNCIGIVRDDDSLTVDVYDVHGTVKSFSTTHTHNTTSTTTSHTSSSKLCFSSHGHENVDLYLTPCFDENGVHRDNDDVSNMAE